MERAQATGRRNASFHSVIFESCPTVRVRRIDLRYSAKGNRSTFLEMERLCYWNQRLENQR